MRYYDIRYCGRSPIALTQKVRTKILNYTFPLEKMTKNEKTAGKPRRSVGRSLKKIDFWELPLPIHEKSRKTPVSPCIKKTAGARRAHSMHTNIVDEYKDQ